MFADDRSGIGVVHAHKKSAAIDLAFDKRLESAAAIAAAGDLRPRTRCVGRIVTVLVYVPGQHELHAVGRKHRSP